ncbi:MAG TPA: hypothetical protein VF618_28125 [Thermoanaerobaculia bacterium]
MRTVSLVLALALALPVVGGKRRAVAPPAAAEEISIAFVELTAGQVDVGVIAHVPSKKKQGWTVVTRTIGVRIDRGNRVAGGTAILRAWLDEPDARCVVRVDGVALTNVPRIIDAHARIGAVTPHRLEIEVPVTAAEGPLASAIRWEVSTE